MQPGWQKLLRFCRQELNLVKELTAPEGYFLSAEELLFTILEDKPGEIVDLTETPVRDQVIRGGFALSKWDLELNEPGNPREMPHWKG